MSGERPITPELFTEFFFNRPAEIVVADLAAQVYGIENDHTVIQEGNPKLLQLALDVGIKTYRIMTAQAYQQVNTAKIWKGKRAEQINKLPSGGVVTYKSRASELTFIKTSGADNILLRQLEDIETGEVIPNATGVSQALHVTHGDTGRLLFENGSKLILTKNFPLDDTP